MKIFFFTLVQINNEVIATLTHFQSSQLQSDLLLAQKSLQEVAAILVSYQYLGKKKKCVCFRFQLWKN